MPSPLSASPVLGGPEQQQQHAEQLQQTQQQRKERLPQRQQSGDSYLLHHQHVQHRRTPSPLPPHLQHHPGNDVALSGERAQSVPPGWAHPSSSGMIDARAFGAASAASIAAAAKHRGSPIDTTAAGLAKRRTTVHIDEATTQKRPMSPHITSATPTSASVRHSVMAQLQSSSSPSAFAGTSAISKRDSIHSPLSAGAVTAPWLLDGALSRTQTDALQDNDDEAGKGHGGRMSVPPARPDSKPFFPLTLSPEPKGAQLDHDQPGSAPPLGHGPRVAEMPIASTSPIIVPQARRGAINLKKAARGSDDTGAGRLKSKRRKRRRRVDQDVHAVGPGRHRRVGSTETNHSSQSGRYGPYYANHRRSHTNEAASYPLSHRPALSSMRSIATILVWNTLQAFLHPLATASRIGRWFMRTVHEIDDAFRDPRTKQRTWKPDWLDAYIPFLIWLAISLSSTGIVIIFHTSVFKKLDELSQTLQRLGVGGQFAMGGLIFLTTFPPMPLYSTLIVLCGFSFGMVEGFIISYIAALSGAIIVFLLSRTLLRGWMSGLLNKSGGLKKVVRAIEKQPKLLFLIRLAPYPYNLMNTLLASSPTLTFKTYTACTALALPKLLVHTGLGTSIKNFAAYHGADQDSGSGPAQESDEDKARSETAERVKRIAGLVGVLLCIGIFFYLMHVARKAVDNLDDEQEEGHGEKDTVVNRGSNMPSSSRSRGRSNDVLEAERQRLYDENNYSEDDDEDEEESLYSDDSDLLSDGDVPVLDGGHAGDDSVYSAASSYHQRPAYGRVATFDGAEIDMRETGNDLDRAQTSWSGQGLLHQDSGASRSIRSSFGLDHTGNGTRYGPVLNAGMLGQEPFLGSGATAVPMSVVSSVSTPLTSLPSQLADGSIAGSRRAVVDGIGPGLLGAKPRSSGVGDRALQSNTATRPRSSVTPRLGPGVLPSAGLHGTQSILSPIAGTPGGETAPGLLHLSGPGHTQLGASTPEGDHGAHMSMEDRIAEMEKSAETYFTSGRRWNSTSDSSNQSSVGSSQGTRQADTDMNEIALQQLAREQRRGAGGPRSASEMGAEEARYGG